MENKEELELLKMLDEAEEDVRNGKVSSIENAKPLSNSIVLPDSFISFSYYGKI